MKDTITRIFIGLCGIAVAISIVILFNITNEQEYAISPRYTFPINVEMTSRISNTNIFITYSVNQNEENYVYYYKLSYKGKDEILVNWDVLKLEGSLVHLKPGVDYEFSTTSLFPPEVMMGKITIYKKESDKWVRMSETLSQVGPVPVERNEFL